MDALVQFNIPVSGLGDGVHSFDFQIDSSFFEHFEKSPIQEGQFTVKAYFDKRPDLYVLSFDISGSFKTTCDRCLEDLNLPIKSSESLMVKFDETEHEEADIVYIIQGAKNFNIAKYIYEFILLAIPMIKTHELADLDCDEEMTKFLEIEETEEPDASENSIWAALKDFKKK